MCFSGVDGMNMEMLCSQGGDKAAQTLVSTQPWECQWAAVSPSPPVEKGISAKLQALWGIVLNITETYQDFQSINLIQKVFTHVQPMMHLKSYPCAGFC